MPAKYWASWASVSMPNVITHQGGKCKGYLFTLPNRRAKPRILLDGRPSRQEPSLPLDHTDICVGIYKNLHGKARFRGTPQDASDPQDGLYFYDGGNRHNAAVALQLKLVNKVMDH